MKCMLCDHYHEDRLCKECDCLTFIVNRQPDVDYERMINKNYWNW